MATHLTRRELYDRVWARPMTKVAAGRQPPKALFREVSDPMLEKVVIAGSPLEALPPAVTAAQQKAKAVSQDAPKPTPIVHPKWPADRTIIAPFSRNRDAYRRRRSGSQL